MSRHPLKAFRPYFIGQTISVFGDRITELALPLTALSILGASALQVAALSAVLWVPAFFSVLIGAWVDRQPWRRRILMACDVGRACLLGLIPLFHMLGCLNMANLYLVGFGVGCGSVVFSAAAPSYFVSLVEQKDYVRANSLISGSGAIAYVVGPAAAGWLIAILTVPNAFIIDAASFIVSACFIARSRAYRRPQMEEESSAEVRPLFVESMKALVTLAHHPILRPILITTASMNLANTAILAILTTFLNRVLGFSASQIGMIFAIAGLGGVAGAVCANPLSNRLRLGAFTTVNYGIRPIGSLLGGALVSLIGFNYSFLLLAVGGSCLASFLIFSRVSRLHVVDEAHGSV